VGRIVLVRHGESTWNVERRIQGQSGAGLTEQGREQAQRTASVLADTYPDAVLVSSDLARCRETAELVAARTGQSVSYEPGLRERDFGSWTGRLALEIQSEDADVWSRWRDGEDVIAEIGGEDTPTLVARVLQAVRRGVEAVDGAPVVCITHGGPILHGTHAMLGLERRVFGGVANCSITELEVDGGSVRLVSWNQVSHLPRRLRMLGGGPQEDATGDEDRDVPLDQAEGRAASGS
jgi:broad specificity phosphatase PhoE